jgi:hypothetical protein
MKDLINMILHYGIEVYAYCTDFVITCANLLHLSYYEVNALLFCIIWPLLTMALFGTLFIQILRFIYFKQRTP